MRSDIKTRFGKTRGTPEHYFRVQVSLDGGQSFTDALVMKKDDRDGPDRHSTPFKVEWAATAELGQEAEAVLGRMEKRYSAKHNKGELEKFLKAVPQHYVPPDAEVPVDLGLRIADSRVERGRDAGTEPNAWEREADAAARRRAGIAYGAGDEGNVRATELFQWVPWFQELAEKVGEGGQKGLVAKANKVDWAGLRCAVLAQGEERADPLTFFYHLASIARSKERRKSVYTSVAEVFGIESNFDYSHEDSCIFPIPPGLAVMFNNTGADPQLFWEMFDQARSVDGTSYGTDHADTFARMLQVKGVGVAKLTQVLFLINPRAFFPFDNAAVLPLEVVGFKHPPNEMSWDEYVGEMSRIRAVFPGCHCYEINVIGYLWTSDYLPRKGNRWYQIAASEDGWPDFRDHHWVHLGGMADQQDYRLDELNPGDVVLVRSGTREGRGIGIVYRNDYSQRSDWNGRVHVLWINKKRAPLATDMRSVGFSRVGRAAYEAFAKSDAYSETLRMLQPPPPPSPPVHPLNTILYGPPGTGKTWHTVTRAVAIVENRKGSEVAGEDRADVKDRFDKYRGAGQVEMVTFHQNTTYEDFVEGIRPVLTESGDRAASTSSKSSATGEVQYEMARGVFRRMAERAANDTDKRYVLIIDEINRGNIARIFGELPRFKRSSQQYRVEGFSCAPDFAGHYAGEGDGVQKERSGFLI